MGVKGNYKDALRKTTWTYKEILRHKAILQAVVSWQCTIKNSELIYGIFYRKGTPFVHPQSSIKNE